MERLIVNIPSERQKLYAELTEKYNPDGSKIRKYQLHLIKTLKEFDTFCRKHDIVYYLAYGSLLGAVRHKGFIPWDDDADIWMDRANYEKLAKLMKGEHHQLTDNVYVAMGIRPTLWSPPFADIDIFILDVSPSNRMMVKWKNMIVKFFYTMVKCRERFDKHSFGKFKPYFILAPLALLASSVQWKKMYNKSATWFTDDKRLMDVGWVQAYNNVPSYVNFRFLCGEDIWEPIEAEFDGGRFMIPKGYDMILQIIYGDYMRLPDKDKICSHGFVENIEI